MTARANDRVTTALRALVVLALSVDVGLFVYVVARRVGFPEDIEWMTGSMLDHIERLRAGEQVYAEPTARWIPFIYPPLYHAIAALLGGTHLACRLLSLAAAAVQAFFVHRLAGDLGASRFWRAAAPALLFAAFPYIGWWYDLERSDTLFGAIMVATCAILLRARTPAVHAAAGALAGIGFLGKQQAIFYFAGAAAALLLTWWRDRKRESLVAAIAFAATGAIVMVVSVAWLDARSGGWFAYYVLKMPRAHGITWSLVTDPTVLLRDLGRGLALMAATIAIGVRAARDLRRGAIAREPLVFASMLLAGFAAALSSRLHIGGWVNVLQPWSSFACVAVAILASRAEARADALDGSRRTFIRAATALVVVGQLASWLYDPRLLTPPPWMYASTARFRAIIASLDERGEVLLVGRGHVTRQRHFQMSALADVINVEGHAPPDLVQGISTRRFAAIVDDARLEGFPRNQKWPPTMLEDYDDLRGPIFANYFVSTRIEERDTWLPMISPALPRWILLPRTKPLDPSAPDLTARRHAELRLALERAEAIARGAEPSFSAAEIEDLAGREPQKMH